MIADLSLQNRRDEARTAVMAATAGMARAQLLVRQEVPGCPDAATRWDRDRVLEHIDGAEAVERVRDQDGQDVVVIRRRGDYVRRVVLSEAGADQAPDIPATVATAATVSTVSTGEAAVVCDPCGLPGDRPHQVHAVPSAAQLATVHDQLHHGGHLTARVVPVEQAQAWEVDDVDGRRVYLGRDLVLAHELCELLAPGAHLIPLGIPLGPLGAEGVRA